MKCINDDIEVRKKNDDVEFLYRGINSDQATKDFKKYGLTAKAPNTSKLQGAEFADDDSENSGGVLVEFGDTDFTFGESVNNAIHYHEYHGNGASTSGISTSPHFSIAKKYALGKNGIYESGVVIKFSVQRLKQLGVEIYRISECIEHPAVPEDDEYWLYCSLTIPEEAIVERIEVKLCDTLT